MTYTVICRDSATGALGIGIATYSLAVGASCPYIRPGVGAVSTQAATFPAHGPALLDLIDEGRSLADAFAVIRASDEHFEFRQIGIVPSSGETHVHTGTATRDWAGSLTGDGWLVMGNVLAGERVVRAMADSVSGSSGSLGERLVQTLEAGRDAGGQLGLPIANDTQGRHLPERSTVVSTYGDDPFPLLDLRVDDHPDAVTEMRRLLDRFSRAENYYRDRAFRPAETSPQDTWMVEHELE